MIVQGREVAEWVLSASGGEAHDRMSALGYVRNKKLVAGFAFENYSGANVFVHQRQDGYAPAQFWHAAARYIYDTLGCERCTGTVPAANKRAQKLNEHLGFHLEARLERCGPAGDDLLVYGMWRDECRILKWGKRHAA